MKPYYQDDWVTLYHGDCREVLPSLAPVDCCITDPVWPNAKAIIPGCDRPFELLAESLRMIGECNRLILHLGCDSDPRILSGVPNRFPFFRVVSLEFACPTRKGRLLYGGDIAYVFGTPPVSAPGRRIMSGLFIATKIERRQRERVTPHKEFGRAVNGDHPCPRRLEHLQWLVGKWSDGIVLDPFAGSGTTLLASKQGHYQSIGIEIEERFCEIAAKRLQQENLQLAYVTSSVSEERR